MLDGLSEEQKRDLAFQLVVGLRDTISIARKQDQPPTYEHAIRLLYDISPEFYKDVIAILDSQNPTETAKRYQELSRLQTLTTGAQVEAVTLINAEIERYQSLLAAPEAARMSAADKRFTRQFLAQLIAARSSLTPERKLTEHRILARDTSRADRTDFGAQFIDNTHDDYTDYKLPSGNYLRIRLLHPDAPERITGAELIYEQHDEERNALRFVFLQYKIWENGVLHFNSSNRLRPQLQKMQRFLCERGYCNPPDIIERLGGEYRLPHCCAFLRPTDKIQKTNAKLISSGIHIPVCNALAIEEQEGGKIDKRYIRHQTLTHKIFEHLFNRRFLGSRWLQESEVRKLYDEAKIVSPTDSIIIYAREIKEESERDFEDLPF